MNRMATNKPNDRHKPRHMVGIPKPIAAALKELADEDFNTIAEQVKIACREYLEKRGKAIKPAKPPKP